MRALTYNGRTIQHISRASEPEPAAGELLVTVLRTGMCGTDLGAIRRGRPEMRPGVIAGHEILGLGADGCRLAINPMLTCAACPACVAGQTNLCHQMEILGIHRDGGFAERVVVPASSAVPVTAEATDTQAALAEPLATALHAWRRSGAGRDARVGIIGAGAIGLCTAAVARDAGAAVVHVADVDAAKHGHASAMGADVTSTQLDGPYDVVIECVGLTATRRDALAALRPGGRAVLVGLADPDLVVEGRQVVTYERDVVGSFGYTHRDFVDAVALTPGCDTGWVAEHPLEDGPALLMGTAVPAPGVAKVHIEGPALARTTPAPNSTIGATA